MTAVKTRKRSYSYSQSWLVGKELHTSEVPTLCAVIQKGIWERVLVELGKAKTESIQKI